MIEARHLTRQFGRTTAVSNVSFRIEDREVVGLLGPNGAGKTTIMRMLSGYLEPTTGSIEVGGESLGQNAYCIQRQLGYLPENLPVYPEMMVADYLDYAATIKGIERSERMRSVREALVATDMLEHALDNIGRLSRGQKQRVGVAQAILGRPHYLILDEPTNGLDPRQTEQMRELIQQLARRATIIVSTHIMQEVEAVCDRVLILNSGQLALDQPLAQLRNCRELLLHTDAGTANLEQCLSGLEGIESFSHSAGSDGLHWRLRLRAGTDCDQLAGEVSQCVLQAGARLYGLSPQQAHLEDIFREVIGDGH
ncbi:ABC transporter ATP-binding protein [Haliea sp. E17]|uniref:ABC transporter ATP-binding protein n=1 Tax=Haliea sp. E17 TaxID=3401576 RepID=UPI003AAC1602